MRPSLSTILAALALAALLANTGAVHSADTEFLTRMPGTQPGQVAMLGIGQSNACLGCHTNPTVPPLPPASARVDPAFNWKGSMMAHAMRDPIFWACLAVAVQDSAWATYNVAGPGLDEATLRQRTEVADICLRCHSPSGWLSGRSTPTTGSAMISDDFDGVHCEACHRLVDPRYKTPTANPQESANFIGYWDEAVDLALDATLAQQADLGALDLIIFLAKTGGITDRPFYFGYDTPSYATYTESASAQFVMDNVDMTAMARVRGPFSDALALGANDPPRHTYVYSRFHKSKFLCATCHDVSNPAIANLGLAGLDDQSGGVDQISEQYPAHRYSHVERTFSEFMLSAYSAESGAPTNAELRAFAPTVTKANKCQDCHMRDVVGRGCDDDSARIRPTESSAHPASGLPLHDLTGGNLWLTTILATMVPGNPAYDAVNDGLLRDNVANLTFDPEKGEAQIDDSWEELLAGAERASNQLRMAGSITALRLNKSTGALSFRLQNNTGHKLISGFLEGRRMWVNIKAYRNDLLVHEINPYDMATGTLKGPTFGLPLGANEEHRDDLVYECKPSSSLTGEAETFHFALATGRHKDNRVPPKGFQKAAAAQRLAEPVMNGASNPAYFSDAEYAGGYDLVQGIALPAGTDRVEVTLYYQGTSKEYVEFLRDEINGAGNLPAINGDPGIPRYLINGPDAQAFFGGLAGWGETIYGLWHHNHGLDGQGRTVPGVVPFAMTTATATPNFAGLPAVLSLLDS